MADDVIYSAIRTFLTTNWTTSPIAWENEEFDRPEPPAPWVLFEITGNLYAQESIGDSPQGANRWDEDGVMFLHVMVPRGSGSHTARQHAKLLADLFRGLHLVSDNLEFLDTNIGEGAPGDESGVWFRVSVSIQWRMIDVAIGD
jgi:hypothetical protein